MPSQIGRPQYGFFIFDCPADHEIDGTLLTESDAIKAVLSNRKLGTRLKTAKCTTVESFKNIPVREYAGIRYVHIGAHASKYGLGFIGGSLNWKDVAKKLVAIFPPLAKREKRVITLSCCHSSAGIEAMKPILKGHFSAAYYFVPEKIGFSRSITTWCMFYLKKTLDKPHLKIKNDINEFMGEEIVSFTEI